MSGCACQVAPESTIIRVVQLLPFCTRVAYTRVHRIFPALSRTYTMKAAMALGNSTKSCARVAHGDGPGGLRLSKLRWRGCKRTWHGESVSNGGEAVLPLSLRRRVAFLGQVACAARTATAWMLCALLLCCGEMARCLASYAVPTASARLGEPDPCHLPTPSTRQIPAHRRS